MTQIIKIKQYANGRNKEIKKIFYIDKNKNKQFTFCEITYNQENSDSFFQDISFNVENKDIKEELSIIFEKLRNIKKEYEQTILDTAKGKICKLITLKEHIKDISDSFIDIVPLKWTETSFLYIDFFKNEVFEKNLNKISKKINNKLEKPIIKKGEYDKDKFNNISMENLFIFKEEKLRITEKLYIYIENEKPKINRMFQINDIEKNFINKFKLKDIEKNISNILESTSDISYNFSEYFVFKKANNEILEMNFQDIINLDFKTDIYYFISKHNKEQSFIFQNNKIINSVFRNKSIDIEELFENF